jgi:hypothetical protein
MTTFSPHPPPENKLKKDSVVCLICGKPVPVENAKTDADGQSVHEDCYALKVKLAQANSDGHGQSDGHALTIRPWKAIAEEVTREQNSEKFNELIVELNQALDEQNLDGTPKSRPDGTKIDGK